ncbi:cell wall metabolism sensor histidine kinase WalK [Paenibacillus urinalis]|uniref:histidine kinase n=1 Tax=Paenibacillus urinalis TaxID=521520 RepID=A0ABY7XC40_9BACL|nr:MULTISPECIES: cell wall metabolism sensor histidine kinase WalK [Paenibacillus]WDH98721.1 cell wall metabolism sensor histidine kinase WalK [Paenibacillus urinalis]WDI02414.1 cell wall metabolism sensor histidine kinase WalK [Paenibacillus urinalis]GAK41497.1 sensor protein [Paenibacillus sp. TCA20]
MKWTSYFRTVQAKLIIVYVLLILVAMQLIGVYFVSAMKTSLTSNFTEDLHARAEMLSVLVAEALVTGDSEGEEDSTENLGTLVNNLFNINGAEIQVLDASGRVLTTTLSSHNDYIGRKNTQTVVSRALQGIRDNEENIIDEDNVRKKVVAKPVSSGGKIVGAVYIAASMNELYTTMERINNIFISGVLIALGLTAVLGVILSHTITAPIKELTRKANAVAEGDFSTKMPVLGKDEIGQLSSTFNYMTSQLRTALSENEEEKDKLSSILANMSDGVIAIDELGRIILVNKRASMMLGRDEAAMSGRHFAVVLGLEVEEAETMLSGITASTLLQIQPSGQNDSVVIRVTFTPVQRRDQERTGAIIVLQDVTEQEELEASRREFVANVSHELRTPLTTIKSYAEALDDGAIEDPELGGRFVGVIQNETERMIRLVTDLLHLSRLDSNEAPLRKQPTVIMDVLDEVADRFSFQMQQKYMNVAVIVDQDVPEVPLDRDQIDQLLDNLVSNALKYSHEGGSVTLSATHMGDTVAISVEDTGIGIPKKDIDRIFERFYRVEKGRSRSMGGTGLGLSIAREIVKAHGGDIELESELGRGTKVTFTLPLEQEGSEL